MKKRVLIFLLFLICVTKFYSIEPPLGQYWYYEGGITLKGKNFYWIADTYREQHDLLSYFDGSDKIDCWLYDTYTYHDGDGTKLLEKYFPDWLNRYGVCIDWEKSVQSSPANYVPSNVKDLMKRRNCDVCAYFMGGNWFNVVNYDKSKDSYWSYMYKVYF